MALHIYLPQDRLRALARGEALPDHTNGAALFADISGFTALTEALRNALGPRRGAEELTRRMEAVYSSLIGEIERHGGSVISFAGDSMLCWFDKAGARQQSRGEEESSSVSVLAVACGLSLQRMMRAYAKITLPDESTTALTLKVAIASGAARRFVVGDSNIQCIDVLAGATVTRTATGEHLAQKGDVVIDGATANALSDIVTIQEWRDDSASGERFAVVASLTQSFDMPIISALDMGYFSREELRAWLHAPLYEREKTGQDSFLTEFRPCTTLFVRFTGIDFDSDAGETQLDTFIQAAQQITAHHGGTLMDVTIGDKGSYIYFNFGVLNAHEDDARRAVNAALELRETTKQLNFVQPLQIGITQGTLRVGAYGGQTRKSFGALGDEVNLAARLMMTATVGEILVSGHVHKAVEPCFVFEPRLPIAMKGKAELLPVFAVTGERRQRAIRLQEPNYALPIVGRAEELKVIGEKLDRVLLHKAQIIGIVAEAGLGKSRLVAEVIRLAHKKGFVGYGGACQSDGVNTSYLAWKSIWSAFFDVDPTAPLKKQMRSVENVLEDYAPNRLQAMPLLNVVLDLAIPENDFTSNLEPQHRKSALRALFEDCLRAAAKDEPILVVIEDVHWIDALSHDLLNDLAKMLVDSPICFVLAYRPPQIIRLQAPSLEAMPNFTRIDLHELTQAEAEQAIRAKLAQLYPARSGALPVALVEKLMARAQGNPFYLEELLNYLHDRGLDPREPQALEKIELPDSLYTLILSRLDQLSEREKTILRVASIVGRFFRVDWLTSYYPELGGLNRVQADLEGPAEMDITPLASPEPELAYVFKHIVTHEVTYESLPFSTRAKLHEQLARYLENTGAPVDIVAHHYGRSDNTAKKREYYRKAAGAAFSVSAFTTALEYSARLLEWTSNDDRERSALALQLAEAHFRLGDFSAARAAIGRAQAAAQTDTDRAAALALLVDVTISTGDYAETQIILAQAVPLARASSDKLSLCRTLSALGSNHYLLDKLDDAKVALEESLMLAREIGDVTLELRALMRLGVVIRAQGDLDESERLVRAVHTRAVMAGNREQAMLVLSELAVVAYERKDYVTMRDYHQQSLALAREVGAQDMVAVYLSNAAYSDITLGKLAAAREKLCEALALALRLGTLRWAVGAVLNFAELAYAEGQTERALALCSLARKHPAWNSGNQRGMDIMFAEWALDPSVVEVGLAKGAELDWDETIEELLKG